MTRRDRYHLGITSSPGQRPLRHPSTVNVMLRLRCSSLLASLTKLFLKRSKNDAVSSSINSASCCAIHFDFHPHTIGNDMFGSCRHRQDCYPLLDLPYELQRNELVRCMLRHVALHQKTTMNVFFIPAMLHRIEKRMCTQATQQGGNTNVITVSNAATSRGASTGLSHDVRHPWF